MDTVAELMTSEPVVVPADASLAECARLLVQRRFRHLPVVGADGGLSGVATDFAVFQRGGVAGAHEELWVPYDDDDADGTVAEVAQPPRLVAGPDDALLPLLTRMARERLDLAVVVDERRHPVGVLTEHDAVRLAQGVLDGRRSADDDASRPVLTVQADEPARAAWDLMLARRVRHLVVLDGERIYGVLSWRDLVAEDVGRGRDITCRDVVPRLDVQLVPPGTPLREVAQRMVRHKIGCVPIAGDGRPSGVVTRPDVIQALVAALEQEQLF